MSYKKMVCFLGFVIFLILFFGSMAVSVLFIAEKLRGEWRSPPIKTSEISDMKLLERDHDD